MPWPQDNSPVQPQVSPGMALWKLLQGAVPSQLQSAGNLAAGVAKPFTNLFGNGGQEFWNGPQDPQAAHDMSNALMTMYAGSATPGAAEMSPAALNVGIGLRHQVSFNDGGAIYHMLSAETGKPLGHIGVEPRGDALHVTNIEAPSGPNSIGPDGMRDVLQQLKQFYPDAKTIEGQRVSGARFGGEYNSYDLDNSPTVSVKLRSGSDKGPNPVVAAMMAESQPQNALTGIKAFHGSPYDFDRFDAAKIGTGEGAQAYGHGLYFAENEGVARDYRDKLGQTLYGGKPYAGADPEVHAGMALEVHNGDKAAARQDLLDTIDWEKSHGRPETVQGAHDALRAFDEGRIKQAQQTGKMYEVNINADPASFLDWDKPLAEQGDAIRNLISAHDKAATAHLDPVAVRDWGAGAENMLGADPKMTGEQIYRHANAGRRPNTILNEPYATSGGGKLAEAGIPGIRYLDQGSRLSPYEIPAAEMAVQHYTQMGNPEKLAFAQAKLDALKAHSDTHNYVVFPGNEHIIEIVKKYGIAATAAMMGMKGSDISQMMGLVGPQQAPQR